MVYHHRTESARGATGPKPTSPPLASRISHFNNHAPQHQATQHSLHSQHPPPSSSPPPPSSPHASLFNDKLDAVSAVALDLNLRYAATTPTSATQSGGASSGAGGGGPSSQPSILNPRGPGFLVAGPSLLSLNSVAPTPTVNYSVGVNTIAFHPERHVVYVATGQSITGYDLLSQTATCSRPLYGSPITRLVANDLYVIAGCEDGNVYILEGEYNTKSGVEPLSLLSEIKAPKSSERQSVSTLVMAPMLPYVFYTFFGSKDIQAWDLESRSRVAGLKMDTKKQTTAITCDLFLPYLLAASLDGSIRIWDYKKKVVINQSDDFTNLATSKSIPTSKIVTVLFHKGAMNKNYIIAIAASGLTVVWELTRDNKLELIAGRKINPKAGQLKSGFVHPTLPFFVTTAEDGTVLSWRLDPKSLTIQPAGYTSPFNCVLSEQEHRKRMLGGGNIEIPATSVQAAVAHPLHGYFAFVYTLIPQASMDKMRSQVFRAKRTPQQLIYVFYQREEPTLFVPKVERMEWPMQFFTESKLVFDLPNDVFRFIDGSKIQSYSLIDKKNLLEDEVPAKDEPTGATLHPLRFIYNPVHKLTLIFFKSFRVVDKSSISHAESDGKKLKKAQAKFAAVQVASTTGGTSNATKYNYVLLSPGALTPRKTAQLQNLPKGRDGVFLGAGQSEFLVLTTKGTKAKVGSAFDYEKSVEINFNTTLRRVFRTPIGNERAVIYFDSMHRRIVFSANCIASSSAREVIGQEGTGAEDGYGFAPSRSSEHSFKLDQDEVPVDLIWKPQNTGATTYFFALLTTCSIRIFSSDFQGSIKPLASYRRPLGSFPFYFYSCYWVGLSVLFTTSTHLFYMTLNGEVHSLMHLPSPGAVIATALPARIIYAVNWRERTQIMQQPTGLLEPIILGHINVPAQLVSTSMEYLRPLISRIVSRYDSLRVREDLIDALDQSGFPDLAFVLIENSSKVSDWKKFELALRTYSFEKALNLLRKLSEAAGEGVTPDTMNSSCIVYAPLTRLASKSLDLEQYKTAETCYTWLQDGYALLQIYAACNALRSVQILKTKALQEEEEAKVKNKPLKRSQNKKSRSQPDLSTTESLPDLCDKQIQLFQKEGCKQGSVQNNPLPVRPMTKWNPTKGTNPIMKTAFPNPAPIDGLKLEYGVDYLPTKLDWNPAFIPSTKRQQNFKEANDSDDEGPKQFSVPIPSVEEQLPLFPKLTTDSFSVTLRRLAVDDDASGVLKTPRRTKGADTGTSTPKTRHGDDTGDDMTLIGDEDSESDTSFSGSLPPSKVDSGTQSSPHATEDIADDDTINLIEEDDQTNLNTYAPSFDDGNGSDDEMVSTEQAYDLEDEEHESQQDDEEDNTDGSCLSRVFSGSKNFHNTMQPIGVSTIMASPSEVKSRKADPIPVIQNMQKNIDRELFSDALEDVELAIRLLTHGKARERVRRQVKFCTTYKLALTITTLIQQLRKHHESSSLTSNNTNSNNSTGNNNNNTSNNSATASPQPSPRPSALSSGKLHPLIPPLSLPGRSTQGLRARVISPLPSPRNEEGAGGSGSADTVPLSVAHLTRCLIMLTTLEMPHYEIMLRTALDSNLEVGNYIFASKAIRKILASSTARSPAISPTRVVNTHPAFYLPLAGFPDLERYLQTTLSACEEKKAQASKASNGGAAVLSPKPVDEDGRPPVTDAVSLPTYTCPNCPVILAEDDLFTTNCPKCNTTIHISYKTLEYLTTDKTCVCTYCGAWYHDDTTKCRACNLNDTLRRTTAKDQK
eukprot:TRINITY_DN5570_c0_g1_i2.p1 TRINITY_DN5570_c0_g1~~TRINITY_DN5570_c0_g1_i2.p1  ORF type:complete len:1758 (-),score=325.62 TRINITY_DN5570_c0_g1_i2:18-5291(-)